MEYIMSKERKERVVGSVYPAFDVRLICEKYFIKENKYSGLLWI